MPHYNLYLDESGTANINDYRDQFFVISGIIIESKYDHDLTSYFTFLKQRYGIQDSTNFHATEFFEGGRDMALNTVSDETASRFCFSLGEIIKTIPLKIVAHSIHKNTLRTILKIPQEYTDASKKINIEDKDAAYEIMIRKLIFEFTSHLLLNNAMGAVIAESRRESDKISLQAYMESQEPFRFKNKPYYSDISTEALKRISSVRFENKRGLTGGLEIADICSYILYRSLHNSLSSIENRGGSYLLEIFQSKLEKPIHSRNGLLLTKKDISRVASDRVNKISDRVLFRARSGTL